MDVKRLETDLGISFVNHDLLRQAFTHSSYVNEHRGELFLDNERLEYLGDAVLELGVSQYLYKGNPKMSEGEMTKIRASIVCEASLATFSQTLQFNNFLLLGKGEEQTGGRNRPSLLADVFEAFLGALFLDQGYDRVISFLDRRVFPTITMGAFSHGMDYKSQLQELIQQDKHVSIAYTIIEDKGPSHDKKFIAQVEIGDASYKGNEGRTKKEAEQRAAKYALDTLNK